MFTEVWRFSGFLFFIVEWAGDEFERPIVNELSSIKWIFMLMKVFLRQTKSEVPFYLSILLLSLCYILCS